MADNDNYRSKSRKHLQQLAEMQADIPGFAQLDRKESRSLTRAAGVDPVFVQQTVYAIERSPTLQAALGPSAGEMDDDAAFIASYGAVAVELAATLKGLNAALLVRRHRLGSTALQAYQLGRVLVRKPSLNADLVPHVQDLTSRKKFVRHGKGAARATPPVKEE
jgi:hypothetical protein